MSIARSPNLALSAFYRRIKASKGPAVANTATARKLAEMYYNAMVNGMQYVEQGYQRYNERYQEQRLKKLQKAAKAMGLTLVANS